MTRRSISASRRLRIFEAAKGCCHICGDKIAGTHERWEVEHLIPLAMGGEDVDGNCAPAHVKCHAAKTKQDAGHIAKGKRMTQRRAGISRTVKRPLPGSRASGWKKCMDGSWVRRE